MKKLIMSFAAVAMAIGAQAVQVKWSTGALYAPNADGSIGATWNGSKWTYSGTKVSTAGSVSAIIWESATALSADAGALYSAYKDGNTASLFSGATTYTGNNSSSASAITVNGGSSYVTGDSVYSAVLYVISDANGKATWYMENYGNATIKASSTTVLNLAVFQGGGTGSATSTAMSWSPVPEPTSAMLLLLGFCGLALKRKNA